MSLMELLTLLTFIVMLLTLFVDVIRLTLEVVTKFSQNDKDNKKSLTASASQTKRSIFLLMARSRS